MISKHSFGLLGSGLHGAIFISSCINPFRTLTSLVSSGWSLSALPPKADIRQRIEHVCFVPNADLVLSVIVLG